MIPFTVYLWGLTSDHAALSHIERWTTKSMRCINSSPIKHVCQLSQISVISTKSKQADFTCWRKKRKKQKDLLKLCVCLNLLSNKVKKYFHKTPLMYFDLLTSVFLPLLLHWVVSVHPTRDPAWTLSLSSDFPFSYAKGITHHWFIYRALNVFSGITGLK